MITPMAVAMIGRDDTDVGRHEHRVGLRGQQARLIDVLFGDEQLHRLIPAGRLDRLGHRAKPSAAASGRP